MKNLSQNMIKDNAEGKYSKDNIDEFFKNYSDIIENYNK